MSFFVTSVWAHAFISVLLRFDILTLNTSKSRRFSELVKQKGPYRFGSWLWSRNGSLCRARQDWGSPCVSAGVQTASHQHSSHAWRLLKNCWGKHNGKCPLSTMKEQPPNLEKLSLVIRGELLITEAVGNSLTPTELPQQHCSPAFVSCSMPLKYPCKLIGLHQSGLRLCLFIFQYALVKQLWASSPSSVLFSIVVWSFVSQSIATSFSLGSRLWSLHSDHLTKNFSVWFYLWKYTHETSTGALPPALRVYLSFY